MLCIEKKIVPLQLVNFKMLETENIEYKSVWMNGFLRWICGFTNVQGDTFYIDKGDNGNVTGVNNAKDNVPMSFVKTENLDEKICSLFRKKVVEKLVTKLI